MPEALGAAPRWIHPAVAVVSLLPAGLIAGVRAQRVASYRRAGAHGT